MTAAALTDAYVGVGANLGDAVRTVREAIAALATLPQTTLERQSPLYRSAPVDAAGPDFVNAVVHLRTALAPHALLDELQGLETRFGRERPYRHAPRTLDLDLLLWSDRRCADDRLVLPHPRLHERAFVLLPLAQIAPGLVVPGRGALQLLLQTAHDQRIERID